MSWLDESTEILRVLINDLDDSDYKYTDNTLEQTLLVAARYVVQEINLGTDYTVNFLGGSVSPDPSSDYIFLNFMILKAACLTNVWTFNEKALVEGIAAKCGNFAQLSVKAGNDIVLGLINNGPCKTYQELMTQQNFGGLGKAVLTPFVSNYFLPLDSFSGRYLR